MRRARLASSPAMGVMKAARLAPDAILLPVDFDAYRHYSRLFKAAVGRHHAAHRGSRHRRNLPRPERSARRYPTLARRIKQAVKDATGLTCSIAISPNKLLSKIGSDLDKPDGLTLLEERDIPLRIWPLPVRKVNGIGPKAEARLAKLGIATIADLAGAEPALLQEHFGRSYAEWLHDAANGIDSRPVVTDSATKSISRETTFERDLHPARDRAALSEVFTALCSRVAGDLQRKGYLGRTIGIKLRYEDFRIVTRDMTLPSPTADPATIRRAAGECLRRVPLERKAAPAWRACQHPDITHRAGGKDRIVPGRAAARHIQPCRRKGMTKNSPGARRHCCSHRDTDRVARGPPARAGRR
jgi:DNA polymerase-4